MNFSEALIELKKWRGVRIDSWTENQYLRLSLATDLILLFYGDDRQERLWHAKSHEILSNNWEIYEEEPEEKQKSANILTLENIINRKPNDPLMSFHLEVSEKQTARAVIDLYQLATVVKSMLERIDKQ